LKKYIKRKIHEILDFKYTLIRWKENICDYIVSIYIFFTRFLNEIFFRKNKSNSKNIMILVSSLKNGGAERVAANLGNELSKKYNVILVTLSKPTENDYKCNAKRIVLKEEKRKLQYFNSVIFQLRKIKKEYNITHCISFANKMNYFNVISKVNEADIISIRNFISLSEKENDYEVHYMNTISIKLAQKIIVVSKELKEDLIKNYNAKRGKTYVIYNYVDNDFINECLKEKKDLKLGNNTVINVGRLDKQKNQKKLIEAFRLVVDKVKDAKLIILGSGKLYDELEKVIKKNKLTHNVKLLGYKKNPFIYMKKSKCFVLSSNYEGFPNSMLEAMSVGLPIISCDCSSGPKEILSSFEFIDEKVNNVKYCDYGILTPLLQNKKSKEMMANAIIEILTNNELSEKYSNLSKERALQFNKEKQIDEWINIIEISKAENKFIILSRKILLKIKKIFTKKDYIKLSKEFFNIKANDYDNTDLKKYSMNSCNIILDYLENIKFKSLLDVGCGTGYLLSRLSNRNLNLVGVDLSDKMIDVCNSKNIKNTKFICASSDNIPCKNKFDVITCSESFHHYPDENKVLREIYRLLNDDGYFIIADNDDGKYGMISVFFENFYNRHFKSTGDCSASTLKRTKYLFKRNNFKVIYSSKYANNTHYFIVGKKIGKENEKKNN